ncbi:MAG: tetratricopeptide repeat protein [Planctomycetaceae bacterium]|nr:tetratricopeptide repeat protein [Planctomycetaceae bacterium]
MKRVMILSVCCLLTHAGCQSMDHLSWSKKSPDTHALASTQESGGLPQPSQLQEASRSTSPQTLNGNPIASIPADTISHLLSEGQEELGAFQGDKQPYHLAKARMNFEEIVRQQPQNGRAHHGLAIVSDLSEDYQSAERHYHQALAQSPNDSNILGDLGFSYLSQNRLMDAEKSLQSALQANPQNRNAIRHLGDVYARQGRTSAATEMYSQVLSPQEIDKALAENSPQSQPLPQIGESVATNESSDSIFEKLMPQKKDRTQELKDDIQRRIEQQRRQESPVQEPQSMANRAPVDVASQHQNLREQLAAIDRERYQRTFNGPVVVDHQTGQLQPMPQGTADPAWAMEPSGRSVQVGYETPLTPSGNSGPWHGNPVAREDVSGPPTSHPKNETLANEASPPPWVGTDPTALSPLPSPHGRPNHQTAYQGSVTSPRSSLVPPDLSVSPANPRSNLPGDGRHSLPYSGQQADITAASQSAAMLGMGIGPGGMFPNVSGSPTVSAPGAQSYWNGDSAPQPKRMLPTDLEPLDLRKAYDPVPQPTPAPGSNMGQTPGGMPTPGFSQQQFGTASRYDTQTLQNSGVPAASHMDPGMQQFELQRQESTRQLNQAVQQVWGQGQMNNMVSPAAGTTYTPPPANGQSPYPMSRPQDFGTQPSGQSGPRSPLQRDTTTLRPVEPNTGQYVEPPPYRPNDRSTLDLNAPNGGQPSPPSPYYGGNPASASFPSGSGVTPPPYHGSQNAGMPMIIPGSE